MPSRARPPAWNRAACSRKLLYTPQGLFVRTQFWIVGRRLDAVCLSKIGSPPGECLYAPYHEKSLHVCVCICICICTDD